MTSYTSLPVRDTIRFKANAMPPQVHHVRTKILGWHLAIVIGQLALMGFAWGFFGAIIRYGQILLPDKSATMVLTSPRSTTAVVTIIGTILSILSSLPISLYSLTVGIELSRKSFALNSRHPWWTLGTAIFVVALSAQTAGWSTLLSPTTLMVERTINGLELDIGSPAFREFVESSYPAGNYYDYEPGVASSEAGDLTSLPTDISGVASAGRPFGIPNLINYNLVTYNISTGGILPTGSPQTSGLNHSIFANGLNFVGGPILSNFSMQNPPHAEGFSSNYSLNQQGFSADVSCQQVPDDLVAPAMYPFANNFSITPTGPGLVNESQRNYTQWIWFLNCPDGTVWNNFDDVTMEGTDGIVWGGICTFQNMSTTNTSGYDASSHLLFSGVGRSYDFINTTMCTIKPKLTTVRVDYTSVVNVSETLASYPHTPSDFGSQYNTSNFDIGQYTAETFSDLFYGSQYLWGNSIGNDISTVFFSQPQSQNGSSQEQLALLNGIMDVTVRGRLGFPESFDPTHPLHLILASSGRGLADAFDWEDFTRNEDMALCLQPTQEGPALIHARRGSPNRGPDRTPSQTSGKDGDDQESYTPSTTAKPFPQ
ncbi:hypothetical protein JAAARDRAFT_81609 [Jaapia argillacea MUCL 33604]|uniref:Uncharacterized protein n=1 Tax=Jaapia argillacea MUCL 33604 TaxID=933084 RepID=A0A067PJ29_9AGAM|nr:hypothetical protein JAAARDRAFT_81609 [Jaapia argillacea MUCL 33604]